MKLIFLIMVLFMVVGCGGPVKQGDQPQSSGICKLENPIDIGTNNPRVHPDRYIKLANITFHQKPRTLLLREKWYEESTSWELFFFEILFNHKSTGFLGFYIEPQQTHNVGFGFDYGGTLPTISGKAVATSNGLLFSTSEPESESGTKDELKIETSGGKIISIEITIPLYVPVEST